MALNHIESFDIYGSQTPASALTERYTQVVAGNSGFVAGRNGGSALQLGPTNGFNTYSFSNQGTWIVGFAFKDVNLTAAAPTAIVQFKDSTTVQASLNYNPATGLFSFYQGNTLYSTGTKAISKGFWYYLEMKIVFHATAGSCQLKINTVTDINASSINTISTANAYANNFAFRSNFGNAAGQFAIDDLYILDTTGSVNNDFLGDMKVEALMPTADGNTIQWTPSNGGPNFTAVGANAVTQGNYIYTNTTNAVDVYQFAPVARITSNIKGVMVNMLARKSDSNAHSIAPEIYSHGTLYTGNTFAVADTAYNYVSQVYETDPGTSTAWTLSGVNSAQYGVKLIS